MEPVTPGFLDVGTLLERSEPRARGGWFWYAAGIFLLLVLVNTYLGSRSPQMRGVVELFSALAMIGVMGAMAGLTWLAVRAHREEQAALEAAEELLQLRRWPEAGKVLEQVLSRPTRTAGARLQGLAYLAAILARYHRFADSIAVYEYLLNNSRTDERTEHGLRLGRAMAMLRDDRLFDADRALAELRRAPMAERSSGLALIEIYRDVKTGHPAEAIELFDAKLPLLREQLGVRVADAYVLVARAYDLLDQASRAQSAYEKATLMASPEELQRRYPEVAPLRARYQAVSAPAEVA